ncbi:class I SAM-dependent methyltransferase [Candidatus Dependentiae bacterium]|nr:class I SAM-dependent methyltransferase [Candidatus Dependentiae bacterium]
MKEQLTIKWDIAAQFIDDDPMRPIRYSKALRYLKNKSKKSTLLDLGCGEGTGLSLLHSLGFTNLTGIEVSHERLKRARNKVPSHTSLKFVSPQNKTLPFENNTFDIVISLAVIEHVLDPNQFVKEVHRILKPGGSAIISSDCWQWRLLQILKVHTSSQPIDRAPFPSKFFKLFKRNNLKLIHYEGFPLPSMKFRFIREITTSLKRTLRRTVYFAGAIIRKLTFKWFLKKWEFIPSHTKLNHQQCVFSPNETFTPTSSWTFYKKISSFLKICFSDENIFFLKKESFDD